MHLIDLTLLLAVLSRSAEKHWQTVATSCNIFACLLLPYIY